MGLEEEVMEEGPQIRAEPELRCGVCDEISEVGVLEGLEQAHWITHWCPMCGTEYEVKLEVEEV